VLVPLLRAGSYQYQSLGFGILIRINHIAKSLNRSFATRCRPGDVFVVPSAENYKRSDSEPSAAVNP